MQTRYGLRPSRLPTRVHRCIEENNEQDIDLHLSTADHHAVSKKPWLNIESARWLKFGSAPTPPASGPVLYEPGRGNEEA